MNKRCDNLCKACPFEAAFSEAACKAQNYGCLPTASDIVSAYRNDNVTISCHDNDKLPCRGLVRYLNEIKERLDFKKAPVYGYSVWHQNGLPKRAEED